MPMQNLWRELRPGPKVPDIIYAIIEIPKGSRNKYEFNKESGVIVLDRVLFSSLHYSRSANHIAHRSQAVELEQFLVKAKVSTYAGGGEGGEEILADGCKELTFQEGGFRYRDRYFGWNPFIGEEVVWEDDQVTWAMNYYGAVFNEVVPAGQVYAFLQRAMNQVRENRPFRGPHSLKEDDYEYIDESQGTVERFTGVERIFYRGHEVYRLNYHGGMVKAK